jgi:uncharacterized repeat protein (TIGR03803 family)
VNPRTYSPSFIASLIIATFTFGAARSVLAQTETTIHTFTAGGPTYPSAALISDATGNLYGTTYYGGDVPSNGCPYHTGCGTVFEISPHPHGWTQTVIYRFRGGANGFDPIAPLVMDSEGNIFGTTTGGKFGLTGTIFELSPAAAGGGWTHKVLHEFTGGKDGGYPLGPLILDSLGNLYGAAAGGGDPSCGVTGCGVVFKLERTTKGGWAEIILHTFAGPDGANPTTGLTWDTAGNLYGSTVAGGAPNFCGADCGVVFRLSPTMTGTWKFSVLHRFTKGGEDTNVNGASPGTLIVDSSGAIYGSTATGGGTAKFGVVFRLTQTSPGDWAETVLYTFPGGTGGDNPQGIVFGPDGVLYGTTRGGGINSECGGGGCGTVFELIPSTTGWTEQVLHTFSGTDGGYPNEILLNGGNLYGTTYLGGAHNLGVVFEATP